MKKGRPSPFAAGLKRLPKIIVAGLIFSAIFAAFSALAVLAANLTGFKNIIIMSAGVIFAAPFYAGLVEVIRRCTAENGDCPTVKTFFSAVRRRFLPFLLYGFTAYLVFCCSFFAIMYYYTLAKTDSIFIVLLSVYMLFAAVLAAMLFNLAIIGATYDIKIRKVYSGAFRLVFKNAAMCLLTLILTIMITVGVAVAVKFSSGAFAYGVIGIAAAVCPTLITYIAVCLLSGGIQAQLGPFSAKPVPEEETEPEVIEFKTDNTEDDYIFVNGKMIRNPNKVKNESKDK